METVAVNGIDVSVDIDYRMSGFRVRAMVYDYDTANWEYVQGFGGELRIMQTPFEALCDLSSELFDEAVWGEVLAEQLGVELEWFDDEEEYQ